MIDTCVLTILTYGCQCQNFTRWTKKHGKKNDENQIKNNSLKKHKNKQNKKKNWNGFGQTTYKD